ncbi:UDP-N-acetylglucosamine transferase subunit ALG14-like isoform X2 [Apium graveolens]|uniref:UDP-N-acetylglucosamine transferase subunit ALG14-like isoform X2 n=1 Tax=Apium graveolens TaxID=4045 RepID=UPI003D7BDE39
MSFWGVYGLLIEMLIILHTYTVVKAGCRYTLTCDRSPLMQGSERHGLVTAKKDHSCFRTMAINVIVIITIALMSVVLRIFYVIYCSSKPIQTKSTKPVSTLIILGSGGHTAEMLNLLSVLQADRFYPRYYIAAATDNMSLQKASVFENQLADKIGGRMGENAQFMQIYRSREVGQSYVTSIGTTIFAVAHALLLMMKIKPQVILCNGPGTCIPLCAIAFFFKVLGIRWSSIFYVESIARVKRLSLSGIILYKLHMADQLFVQWPQLQRKYPRAHYVGRLM